MRSAWDEAVKKANVLEGFRLSGQMPFNPPLVLNKLMNAHAARQERQQIDNQRTSSQLAHQSKINCVKAKRTCQDELINCKTS